MLLRNLISRFQWTSLISNCISVTRLSSFMATVRFFLLRSFVFLSFYLSVHILCCFPPPNCAGRDVQLLSNVNKFHPVLIHILSFNAVGTSCPCQWTPLPSIILFRHMQKGEVALPLPAFCSICRRTILNFCNKFSF